MSQSNSSSLLHESLFSDLHDQSLPNLSLDCAFQPTTGTCLFERYKSFTNQSPEQQIVTKVFKVLPDDHEAKAKLKKMVNMLQNRWTTVDYSHSYISPTWSVSANVRGMTVPAIVTLYYRNGNVLDYLRLHPSTDCLNIVCQAASALAYIHSKGVVHGNVCPENICIADDSTVRLTDIGVNTHVRTISDSYTHSVPSNWMYKSGEEVELGICTTQTDIYSFVTTAYSIHTLKHPFPSNTHSYGRGLRQIVEQGHDNIFGNSKPPEMSDELWDVVRMGWAMEPSQRPSMSEMEGKLRSMHEVN